MEKNAIFGHTGFVGGNLLSQQKFQSFYNSSNIREAEGQIFDTIVIASAPGVKWHANLNPENDTNAIKSLTTTLRRIDASRVILISTVDVFGDKMCASEDDAPEPNDIYGKNRLILEQEVSDIFRSPTILRLPGLFGDGLKKNIIFDFINSNEIEKIDPFASYQFYPLSNLSQDIKNCLKNNIKLIHLISEPIKAGQIYYNFFKDELIKKETKKPVKYDIKTKYGKYFGSQKREYIYTRDEIEKKILKFMIENRTSSEL